MRLPTGIRVALLLLCLVLSSGCGSTTLYVIDKQDFYEVQADSPLGNDRHGYFLSDLYMTKVVEAKVKK